MLYRGILGTAYSGSIAAITASHTRGTQYFRERRVPINPNTERQQLIRHAMTSAAEDWGSLGPEYWGAWARFAASVRRTNAIGQESSRAGMQEYIRWAVPRSFANSILGTDLPLFPAVPTGPQVQIDYNISATMSGDGDQIEFILDADKYSAMTSDDAVLFWVGAARGAAEPPINNWMEAQHHYFRGPWYLAGMIRGETTNLLDVALHAPLLSGQKQPWKAHLSTLKRGYSTQVGGHAVTP